MGMSRGFAMPAMGVSMGGSVATSVTTTAAAAEPDPFDAALGTAGGGAAGGDDPFDAAIASQVGRGGGTSATLASMSWYSLAACVCKFACPY